MRWALVATLVLGTSCSGADHIMPPQDGDDVNTPEQTGDAGDATPQLPAGDGNTAPQPAGDDGDPSAGPVGQGGDGRGDDGDGQSAPSTATVHFIGRFDSTAAGGPRADWSASSISAAFQGTGITARIAGDDNFFELFIDGLDVGAVHFVPYAGDPQTLDLARGLPNGRHTVELMRRTEAFFGPTQFQGFAVADGALVETPYPYVRHMEVIGDSISCGYGDEGEDERCWFTADTENASSTYAAQTARALDAGLSVIAFSGKGMYRDLNFDTTSPMPTLYDRTLLADPTKKWTAVHTPDVVVINLGTNDFSNGDPGKPYADAYLAFLARLHSLYPDAEIFCLAGGMLNTQVYLDAVQSVVTQRRALGDERVHYVELPPTRVGEFGCDWHPGAQAHAASAATLTEAIREVTGW